MATKSKQAAAAEQTAAAYEVTSPLEHDGVRYAAGETVELTAAQAEALLGVAVKAMPSAAAAG
jgi:hypothetical protein